MLAAILTTFFFALSGVCGQRVAIRLGSMWGNFIRLVLSALVLGLVVFLFFPESLQPETFFWFVVSGLVGFGLGDVALFLAYERIGSRLTILLNLCFAPVFGMLIEWLWLGNRIAGKPLLASVLILLGVIMAVRPRQDTGIKSERIGSFAVGVFAAIVAGFGQGCGAVISRKAEEVAIQTGTVINGIGAAFQRVFAGLVVAAIVVFFLRLRGKVTFRWKESREIAPWLWGAALFGPVIGVSCFQWALQTETSGVVLAIVAITPIVMMPMAAITENDRPTLLAILGAIVAVAGVILLNHWLVPT